MRAIRSEGRARILIEASTDSAWVARLLEGLGRQVIVADPKLRPDVRNPDAEGQDGSARCARPGRRQPARGLPPTVWSSSLLSVVYTVARATAGARPGPRPGGARAARTR